MVASMSLYAAFLRGMNVGGHRLTNDELRSCFAYMGFREVASFRASGNIIFAGDAQPPAAVRERIEEGLEAALGYAVPTFIRTADEMRAIAEMQPFDPELVRASGGKLQVAILSSAPAPPAVEALLSLASDRDRLALDGRELYWLPSGGILDAALDMRAIEKLAGSMTMRTKNTIDQIAARHFAR
jgi:uncharacterized protein (DUF1697 family)